MPSSKIEWYQINGLSRHSKIWGKKETTKSKFSRRKEQKIIVKLKKNQIYKKLKKKAQLLNKTKIITFLDM